ncbi:MAG: PilZ domain-containing protein [Terriglobales bacterium]
MMLQALLVSKDDQTAETLTGVLSQFGIVMGRSDMPDAAVARLREEYFEQVIVDFDDPASASVVLTSCLAGPRHPFPVTVAVLPDAKQIRAILGTGAHFILIKPVNPEQVRNTFMAASALVRRAKQQAVSVAVQAPVAICLKEDSTVEGILLELSADGMEVLAAQPLTSSALVRVSFELPDGACRVEAEATVAWSIGNGQTGLRFLDLDDDLRRKLNEWLTSHSQDIFRENTDTASPCKLTDLSLGGCYVQTQSPLPQSSTVDLRLLTAGVEIHAEGLVRVMHPGHGMGIELPQSSAVRRSVGELIDLLTRHPGTEPQLEVSPRSLVASHADWSPSSIAENDGDPLLELLRSGGGLDEEEFLAELAGQRTPAYV